MVARDVLQIGDLRLKKVNTIVSEYASDATQHVIQDCIDTMRAADLIGIAAPQVGHNFQIFVTEPRETEVRTGNQVDELRVYINPKIVNYSVETSIIYEGCGSVCHGGLFGPVLRSKEIIIEAFDAAGKKFSLQCDGILARVIQHEYDHMSGIEFTEKIADYKKLLSHEFYMERIRNSEEQKKASVITKKVIEDIL